MAKKKATAKKKGGPKDWRESKERMLGVGHKTAIEILEQTIRDSGKKPPVIDMSLPNPAAKFVLDIETEIAQWDQKRLARFVAEVTRKNPVTYEVTGLIGEAKRAFFEMFGRVDPLLAPNEVLHYASVWKLWPHVRRKGKEEEDEMATKHATKKKVGKKRPSKKAPVSKAAPKKTSAKKTPVKKTAAKKTSAKEVSLSADDKVKAVPDSREPKLEARQEIKKAAKSAIKVDTLCKKTGCKLRTLESMIKLGFLEVV